MASFLVFAHTRLTNELFEAFAAGNVSRYRKAYIRSLLIELQLVERKRAARKYAYRVADIKSFRMEGIAAKILKGLTEERPDDDAFINYLTLNKVAFEAVVKAAEPFLHASRKSVLVPSRLKRIPAGRGNALNCEEVVALALRWLSTRHRQKDLQLEFGVAQSTISNGQFHRYAILCLCSLALGYSKAQERPNTAAARVSAPFVSYYAGIWEGLRAIVAGLSDDPRAFPDFPDEAERENFMELIRVQYGDAPIRQAVYSFADGSLFLVDRPPTEALQLLMFSGKDKVHAWNCIFITSPAGKIIA